VFPSTAHSITTAGESVKNLPGVNQILVPIVLDTACHEQDVRTGTGKNASGSVGL
jgi:hypothetical protein